jgi:hypothetical protein
MAANMRAKVLLETVTRQPHNMKRDYNAILTVHRLRDCKEKDWRRLMQWLRDKADDIEKSEPADWASTVRFRLMK